MCLFYALFYVVDAIRVVRGEGMPIHRRPDNRGNLYVKFEIIFPPNNFVDSAKVTVCIYCVFKLVYMHTHPCTH